jgi:hypothetical protein
MFYTCDPIFGQAEIHTPPNLPVSAERRLRQRGASRQRGSSGVFMSRVPPVGGSGAFASAIASPTGDIKKRQDSAPSRGGANLSFVPFNLGSDLVPRYRND